MKHTFILEIDGVRHKLIDTKCKTPCKKCSLKDQCKKASDVLCRVKLRGTHYRKCKPGE